MSQWVAEQTDRLQRLAVAWDWIELQSESAERDLIAHWSEDVEDLAALEDALRSQGRWISGPADLMSVLEIERDEVKHCRVLAWLLDPNGAHALGDRFLRRFLRDLSDRGALGLVHDDLGGVSVSKEESRELPETGQFTRADVVVRSSSWTVVVEAKVLAGEQPQQGARLELLWRDENPVFVFLTKTGKIIRSGSSRWITYTWRDVARGLRTTLDDDAVEGSLAVRSYLETLEAHLR